MASRCRVCRALLSERFVGAGPTLPPDVGATGDEYAERRSKRTILVECHALAGRTAAGELTESA